MYTSKYIILSLKNRHIKFAHMDAALVNSGVIIYLVESSIIILIFFSLLNNL